jgi:hypothetical protein
MLLLADRSTARWTARAARIALALGAGATSAVACSNDARVERRTAVDLPPLESAAPSAIDPAIASAAPAPSAAAASSSASAASSSAAVASAPADEPGDRIYAKARNVWIQPSPKPGTGWLGYLSLGGSVRLYEGDREKAKTWGPGCPIWYRVEPIGYVCGNEATTLDPKDPEYVGLARDAAKIDSAYPYHYGESLGSPRYDHVPTLAEQKRVEWDLDAHLAKIEALRAAQAKNDMTGVDPAYVGLDLTPAGDTTVDDFPVNPFVREARDHVARASTVAFVRAFDQGGRTWLVTSDHTFMPKDRVRPYPEVTFHGVKLDGEVALPIAFVRKKDAQVYAKKGDDFEATGDTLARLSWFMTTGERVKSPGGTFLATKDGRWVKDEGNLTIAEAATDSPFRADEQAGGRRTWLDISIFGGTLVAYEDHQAVYATLIAPGRGGIPFPGKDPVSTASTPVGTFRVDGKFKTATMVSSFDSNIVHDNVQWVQNFHGPHALHGAYWHDGWGELKSGGCVNLSPIDSKFLFEWTDPQIPKDWYGMRSDPVFGAPTRVRVRR